MGAALILCRVARACARRSMPPDMMAADFCSAHGAAFVEWLRANTQECKCDEKYGNDEKMQRGTAEILCRRCFVPVGKEDVRPREPAPLPPWPCTAPPSRARTRGVGCRAQIPQMPRSAERRKKISCGEFEGLLARA